MFGVLADPAFPSTPSLIESLHAAARTLGLQLIVVNASTDNDFESAFAAFSQQSVGAVLVGISALYPRRMEQLAALTSRRALPAIFPYREFALAGGLMSYGFSIELLKSQGMSNRAIAHRLGVSEKAIRKLVGASTSRRTRRVLGGLSSARPARALPQGQAALTANHPLVRRALD
jgi:hypothetical protein